MVKYEDVRAVWSYGSVIQTKWKALLWGLVIISGALLGVGTPMFAMQEGTVGGLVGIIIAGVCGIVAGMFFLIGDRKTRKKIRVVLADPVVEKTAILHRALQGSINIRDGWLIEIRRHGKLIVRECKAKSFVFTWKFRNNAKKQKNRQM